MNAVSGVIFQVSFFSSEQVTMGTCSKFDYKLSSSLVILTFAFRKKAFSLLHDLRVLQ